MAMASSGYHHFDQKKDYHHQWPLLCQWIYCHALYMIQHHNRCHTVPRCSIDTNVARRLCYHLGLLCNRQYNANTTQIQHKYNTIKCKKWCHNMLLAPSLCCSALILLCFSCFLKQGDSTAWLDYTFGDESRIYFRKLQNVFVQNMKMYFSQN